MTAVAISEGWLPRGAASGKAALAATAESWLKATPTSHIRIRMALGSDAYCESKAEGDRLKGDMTLRRPNS